MAQGFRNARTVILNDQLRHAVLNTERDVDGPLRGGVADGIVEQVAQHHGQRVGMSMLKQAGCFRCVEAQLLFLFQRSRCHLPNGGGYQCGQVDAAHGEPVLPLLEPGELKHLGDGSG